MAVAAHPRPLSSAPLPHLHSRQQAQCNTPGCHHLFAAAIATGTVAVANRNAAALEPATRQVQRCADTRRNRALRRTIVNAAVAKARTCDPPAAAVR